MLQRAFAFSEELPSDGPVSSNFPSTRYQGSKRKLLPFLHAACREYDFSRVLDLYSGTSSVGLLFRSMGKEVTANDYLLYNWTTAKVMLGMTGTWLSDLDVDTLIARVFRENGSSRNVVADNYADIYFTDDENVQIDTFCSNLTSFESAEADFLIYLMGQAMLMKRPYNLFHRANLAMRTKDVPRSFGNAKTWETPFQIHMGRLARQMRKCEFSGPRGRAECCNASELNGIDAEPDLVYLDPPYLNARHVAVDYSMFYHFLDGLVDYGLFARGDQRYPHRPIALKPSRWRTADGGLAELSDVIRRWPAARLAISYRGDGRPSIDELCRVLLHAGYAIDKHAAVGYRYALSSNVDATEELIIGTPPTVT